MRHNESFDVCNQDAIDLIAKRLHGEMPFLDDSFDEGLLDDEWIGTWEFPCASSSKSGLSLVQLSGKPMLTREHT
jgi:hypothetical protein